MKDHRTTEGTEVHRASIPLVSPLCASVSSVVINTGIE
jgi:hypothetical protein